MVKSSADLAKCFGGLQERVSLALSRANRPKGSVKILAVTKTVSAKTILDAYALGHRQFGENRVQELIVKRKELPSDIEWHFIGHLQTNKVKQVVGEVALIHSLDSIHLAQALRQEGDKRGVEVPVLIQVNTSRESTQYGFSPEECEQAFDELQKIPHLSFRGLMTIAPLSEDESKVRGAFKLLRELKEKYSNRFDSEAFKELSMGMTHDFEWAIEEGATIIRVGTLLFGKRD